MTADIAPFGVHPGQGRGMIKLLEEAIEKVQTLSPEMQEQAARFLLTYAGDAGPTYVLTPEERADLAEADADIERGDFATDAEVRAMWTRHRL